MESSGCQSCIVPIKVCSVGVVLLLQVHLVHLVNDGLLCGGVAGQLLVAGECGYLVWKVVLLVSAHPSLRGRHGADGAGHRSS